jgi:hypothetical protein
MIGSSILIGGPIVAGVMACWNQIKTVLAKARSLIIINVAVEGSLADAVAFYCWKKMSRVRIGDRKYAARTAFVRSKERYQQIAYEIISRSGVIFWKGWKPLFIGTSSESQSNDSGESSGSHSMLSFTFIRGTWDMDDFISEAITLYNAHNHSGFQCKRFYVAKRYGSFGIATGQKLNSSPDVAEDRICLWDKRLVGTHVDDIGQRTHESGEPFEALALPKPIWGAITDIERWKNSEDWYKEKSIPWKRGWLLHGPPGTGKTSVVRAIGEYLDVPVISFCLSSFSDIEFQEEWDRLRSCVPCIALIEDIDTVFEGRNNITKGGQMHKPLSFDTLLNTIDGISSSDGVFTIITTNRPELLDPALGRLTESGNATRPGRIDKIIELTTLDEECRNKIAQRILCDYPEHINKIVTGGDGDTGAQFQDRCSKLALKCFWDDHDEATFKPKSVMATIEPTEILVEPNGTAINPVLKTRAPALRVHR